MTDQTGPRAASVQQRLIRGSAWMIAWRWSIRGIGLVSTIALARLLTPADFGLIAMATLVVGLIEVFGDAEFKLAIIRHPNPTREHLDTAWTLAICTGAAVALVLAAVAPLGAAYFHEPRAIPLIRFLALRAFIDGFENIGVALILRRQDFARDFRYQMYQRVTTFFATIILAVVLQSYWALAIGIVGGRALSVGLSYTVHSYRPRISLSKVRDIWSFSAWMLISNIGNFAATRVDEATVGGLAGTNAMGHYNVAADVATAPTFELILPTERALFPVLASIVQDATKLKSAYMNVLSAVAIVSCATGVGVALVAKDMVIVVLGSQWNASAPLITWLALSAVVWGICHGIITVLNVAGRTQVTARLVWVRLAIFLPSFVLAGVSWGAEGVAVARFVAMLVFGPLLFLALQQVISVSAIEIIQRVWRPTAAAAFMAIAVEILHASWIAAAPLRLLYDVAIGAITFPSALMLLWAAFGRPPGLEAAVAEYLLRFVRRSHESGSGVP